MPNPEWTTFSEAFAQAAKINKQGATAIVLAPAVGKKDQWKQIAIKVPSEDRGKFELVYPPNVDVTTAKPISSGITEHWQYGGISGGMRPGETLEQTLAREAPVEIASHSTNPKVKAMLVSLFAVIDVTPLPQITFQVIQLYSRCSPSGLVEYKARANISANAALVKLDEQQHRVLREMILTRQVGDLRPNQLRTHFAQLVKMYSAYLGRESSLHV